MRDDRTTHYRSVAARLREIAKQTQFADMRESCLNLASQFDRLALSAERPHRAANESLPGEARLDEADTDDGTLMDSPAWRRRVGGDPAPTT